MCKFCTTEPGDTTSIGTRTIKHVVGDRVRGEDMLEFEYYVNDNDIPEHYLSTTYRLRDGTEIAGIEVPIKYCPFCGQKVHND